MYTKTQVLRKYSKIQVSHERAYVHCITIGMVYKSSEAQTQKFLSKSQKI